MACSFTDKLATEVRLQIYEYLLNFNHPLRPITGVSKRKRRCFKNSRNRDDKRINASIMGTCKKVYFEAIGVFYKCNTFSLRHTDVCLNRLLNEQKSCVRLLEHAEVAFNIARCGLSGCWKCRPDALAFPEIFNRSRFPRLQTVKVKMSWECGHIVEVDKALHAAYLTNFTGVGCFEVITDSQEPKISVEYTGVRKVWRYFTRQLTTENHMPSFHEAKEALPEVKVLLVAHIGVMLSRARMGGAITTYLLAGTHFVVSEKTKKETYKKLTQDSLR